MNIKEILFRLCYTILKNDMRTIPRIIVYNLLIRNHFRLSILHKIKEV